MIDKAQSRPSATSGAAKARPREWIGLAVMALPCLIYSMDLTVLHLAVPQITADLKPSASELLWIVDIYGFMVAGALITMGTLGDRIGRRRLLLAGAAAFAVTSLAAAFATSAEMLIAARAAQGLAGATLAPSTLSLIRNMFLDAGERTFAIGVWIACYSVGAAIGPVVGGLILAHTWWGAVFLPNVPVMIVLLALGPFLLPEFRDPDAGRMDILSALQSMAAILLIIYGIKRLAEGGWAPLHGAAIALGLALAVMFWRRERRLADPMIDVDLFLAPAIGAALAVNVVAIFVIVGVFLFIAQHLQLVLGMGPLEAGIWTAPAGIVFALGSLAAPALVRAFRPASVIAVGFLVSALGFALLAGVGSIPSPWLLFVGMMVFCIGLAPMGTITTDLVMTEAPPERAGAASAISETSFELGGALGVAVLGSIATAVYRSVMEGTVLAGIPPAAMAGAKDTLGAAVDVAKGLPEEGGAALLAAARDAFVVAFEVTAVLSALLSVLAGALALRLLRSAGQSGKSDQGPL